MWNPFCWFTVFSFIKINRKKGSFIGELIYVPMYFFDFYKFILYIDNHSEFIISINTILIIVMGGIFSLKFSCIFICSRSEEHTSELQSRPHLVCRLLLEKKKK